jgi:hypothetical protein
VIVARATVEGTTTELHVLSVRQGVGLEQAMRLLRERPPSMVGRIQRLPADLPTPGEVLRLDARAQASVVANTTAARRERRRRDLAGGRP